MTIALLAMRFDYLEPVELKEHDDFKCSFCGLILTSLGPQRFLYASHYGIEYKNLCAVHHADVQAFARNLKDVD